MACFVRALGGAMVDVEKAQTLHVAMLDEHHYQVLATFSDEVEYALWGGSTSPAANDFLNSIAARANAGATR